MRQANKQDANTVNGTKQTNEDGKMKRMMRRRIRRRKRRRRRTFRSGGRGHSWYRRASSRLIGMPRLRHVRCSRSWRCCPASRRSGWRSGSSAQTKVSMSNDDRRHKSGQSFGFLPCVQKTRCIFTIATQVGPKSEACSRSRRYGLCCRFFLQWESGGIV